MKIAAFWYLHWDPTIYGHYHFGGSEKQEPLIRHGGTRNGKHQCGIFWRPTIHHISTNSNSQCEDPQLGLKILVIRLLMVIPPGGARGLLAGLHTGIKGLCHGSCVNICQPLSLAFQARRLRRRKALCH